MANAYLPYGYIYQFGNYDFAVPGIMPLACRLKSPRTARILTLANGRALNQAPNSVHPTFPIDQELEILIHGNAPGMGNTLNATLLAITDQTGQQEELRVRVPNSVRVFKAQAVLDYCEFTEDGQMDDSGVVNWSIVRFYFKQLELFHD